MSHALTLSNLPRDPKTGLTLPLGTSLESSTFKQHKAMVAVELEVLAKKFDRFGWDRDRGSHAQDRLIRDWIEALCNFPIEEITAACRAAVIKEPNKMPNEGHILACIMEARRAEAQKYAAQARNVPQASDNRSEAQGPSRVSPEAARDIMKEYGFSGAVNIGGKFNE